MANAFNNQEVASIKKWQPKNTKEKKAADDAVKFIKHLKHTKGEWAGRPFTLLPWQEHEIVRPLFGTLNKDGTRQYRTAYIEVPKKNGKSELAAAIALKLLCADGESGAEVYSAAADRFQASLVSNVAMQMVRTNVALSNACHIIESQKRIIYPKNFGVYITLSADVETKHGVNASGVIFDELHAQKTRDLWQVLTFGSMTARRQPLLFTITTAGYDRNSVCWEQHDYATRVLKHREPEKWSWVQGHPIDDPTFLPVIYLAKDDDDWSDEDLWRRVNPSMDHIFGIEILRHEFEKAKVTPSLENDFRRFRLNQWVKQSVRFMNMEQWDACNLSRLTEDSLKGRVCFSGLDLSSNRDVTALVLVFPPDDTNGVFDVFPYFFIPEYNMKERSRRDSVPYELWVKQGYIKATPGNVVDYSYIFHTLKRCGTKFDLREIAYDRWGATKLAQDMQDDRMPIVPFGQGFASMAGPTKELETLVLSERINHGGNPVLRWMADNMVVKTDPAGNIKPDKEKSTEKIDGIVATIMGLDRAMKTDHRKERWDGNILL